MSEAQDRLIIKEDGEKVTLDLTFVVPEGCEFVMEFCVIDRIQRTVTPLDERAKFGLRRKATPAPTETLETQINRWLNTRDTGASSEAVAFAALGGRSARFGDMEPADSHDLGRCLRLIQMVPEARQGVRLMATRSEVWALLEAAWDELTQMGMEDGLLVFNHRPSRRINARLRELRWRQHAPGTPQ